MMYQLEEIAEQMKMRGMNVIKKPVNIHIQNGTSVMLKYYVYFIKQHGEQFVNRPEYAEVGKWLEDNQCKGLFMYGGCGTGKSFLARMVIPAMLLNYERLVVSLYDATDLNKKPDDVINKPIICLDDIGVENKECVIYGQHRQPLGELLDSAEKNGKLVIMTSNLNGRELLNKYGERTLDRIKSMTKRIPFTGDSFRK